MSFSRRAARVASGALGLLLSLTAGCADVLGIEEATFDEGIGKATGRQSCVLNSHCEDGNVCIFRVCSAPCEDDRDCSEELACLRTGDGTACVDPGDSTCEGSEDCPGGTVCSSNVCRTTCGSDEEDMCLSGQSCLLGSCRSERLDGDSLRDLLDQAGIDGGLPDASMPAGQGGAGGSGAGGAGAGMGATDASAIAECEAADAMCEDGVLYRCRSDQTWDEGTRCAYVCLGDECSGECVPDDTRCLDQAFQRCDDDGLWQEEMTCPRVCTEEGCVDRCEAGEEQCNDNEVLVCTNAGTFMSDRTCPFLCRAGSCIGECLPDAPRCIGGVSGTCDADGEWQTGIDCEFVCTGDVCGGECVPSDHRCKPGSVDVRQLCTGAGVWMDDQTCPYVCDTDSNACGGECEPGDYQCEDGSADGRELCSDSGEWEADDPCPFVCDDASGNCGGSCDPGDYRCRPGSANVRQICTGAGAWMDTQTCPYVCDSSTDACGGECVPDDERCKPSSATVPQTCGSDGLWDDEPACPFVCVVATGACGGQCVPDDTRCEPGENVAQVCDEGTWTEDEVCEGPDEICESGACVANDPYVLGHDAVGGADWATYDAPASYVITFPIMLAREVHVLSLHVRGNSTPSPGVLARMTLYHDDDGEPGARMAMTNNFSVISGNNGIDYDVRLPAGRYWLAAIFSGSAPIYRSTAAANPDAYLYSGTFPTLPDPFPVGAANAAPDRAYSLSMIVQDVTP